MSNTQAEVPPSLGSSGTQMSDLQMTKLCADAMELRCKQIGDPYDDGRTTLLICTTPQGDDLWNPLTDDAQAMALVKKMNLTIIKMGRYPGWHVTYREPAHDDYQRFIDDDLNRAIVVCIARVQVDRTAREASAEATNK